MLESTEQKCVGNNLLKINHLYISDFDSKIIRFTGSTKQYSFIESLY